jgi:hypothetical protein
VKTDSAGKAPNAAMNVAVLGAAACGLALFEAGNQLSRGLP